MLPRDLTADHFRTYPPQARNLATRHLALLRKLPIGFVPLLVREMIDYDWKFPAERAEIDGQLSFLSSLPGDQLSHLVAPFAALRLPPEIERLDWAAAPNQFSERLTAHLWATQQIDSFRAASVEYIEKVHAAVPEGRLPPVYRLGIVVIGASVAQDSYPLFRRLRPRGVWYRQLQPADGLQILKDAVASRAAAHPLPYGHWHIDGGTHNAPPVPGVASISWEALAPLRVALLERMRKAIESGIGAEALRTMLAEIGPRDLNLSRTGDDEVLGRFQLSLLTEGSGTQLFSTTLVQWAAREALRRAQPLTMLVHYAPRVRELSLGELISNTRQQPPPDPEGSLIDADMGAYYTWLCQQRLSGAEQARFLVWFEGHGQAMAIGPSLKAGTECEDRIGMSELLNRMT